MPTVGTRAAMSSRGFGEMLSHPGSLTFGISVTNQDSTDNQAFAFGVSGGAAPYTGVWSVVGGPIPNVTLTPSALNYSFDTVNVHYSGSTLPFSVTVNTQVTDSTSRTGSKNAVCTFEAPGPPPPPPPPPGPQPFDLVQGGPGFNNATIVGGVAYAVNGATVTAGITILCENGTQNPSDPSNPYTLVNFEVGNPAWTQTVGPGPGDIPAFNNFDLICTGTNQTVSTSVTALASDFSSPVQSSSAGWFLAVTFNAAGHP